MTSSTSNCQGLLFILHSFLVAPPYIIRVIKSWQVRWSGHVARMGGMRNKFWLGNLKGRNHSEDLGADGG